MRIYHVAAAFTVISSLMLLSSGCAQVRMRLLGQPEDTISMQFTVQPQVAVGSYTLQGRVPLPNGTAIAVAAVRYLRPTNATIVTSNTNLTYAILDYQEVEVADGEWNAVLNLWDVASDGRYQEDWQRHQERLNLAIEPETEVVFVAMPSPITNLAELDRYLSQRRSTFADEIVRFSPDGERYVQISKAETIDLPTGQTTPPGIRPQDINDGWGERYILYPEPPTEVELEMPSNRRTNAPASPAEFLQ
jgi:hypothetical protein